MSLPDVWAWLALALALVLVPVHAMPTAEVDRTQQAEVVDGSQAYLADQTHDPVLNASNGYEDEALTITHQYVEGSSVRVWVNNTASDPRFTFQGSPFTLTPGTSGTVSVTDTDDAHPAGSHLVEAEITGEVTDDGRNAGRQTIIQDVSVTVE